MQIFQKISDTVCYSMCQKGSKAINYVDDFIGVKIPDVASTFAIFWSGHQPKKNSDSWYCRCLFGHRD